MSLEKLNIKAFKDASYSKQVGSFNVLINPETYKTDLSIEYAQNQGIGTAGAELRFKAIQPQEINFTLVFDGTNLITTAPQSLKGKSVAEQIELFQKTTTQYDGSIHRPYFLELVWGNFFFQGVLTKLSISYKLFKADGTPLRAEATANFKTSSTKEEILLKAKNKSPDVTHIRTFMAGERLPLMCNEIYGGPNYYIQVARYNQIDHLRQIPIGQKLVFPPLQNS